MILPDDIIIHIADIGYLHKDIRQLNKEFYKRIPKEECIYNIEIVDKSITNLDYLKKYRNLLRLNCSMCLTLSEIPLFPKLTKLNCGFCLNLLELPLFPNLTILLCGCTRLIKLPFPKLSVLDCSSRRLFPEIPPLPNLLRLFCGYSNFTKIPLFPNLTYLNCNKCPNLTEIPPFPKLTELSCEDCPNLTIPDDLKYILSTIFHR
jgi:hypothetical protein